MMNGIENTPSCLNWASRIKQLLSTLGFYEVWVNQGVGNKNMFLCVFKQRFLDNFPKDGPADLKNQTELTFIHNVLLLKISLPWILLGLKI